ncbi:MAG TPA: nucleotidyltransferase domain-containing protein [bacterium]|nr:nucleotidyltransferase domain-containing protein [bacterium]HDP99632.1 nucleotidyltransferase domain-containing protein [bacterium]
MAQVPDKIKKTIYKFLAALQENNIPVKRAILFGSYAHGNYNEWSDIDLAVVSDFFIGDRFDDKKKIRPITLSISYDLEILPYNTQDFTEDDPFVKEIIKTGIEIV